MEGLNVNILFFLSKLPTAKETAHLIIQRVFFIHGLSVDIILDQAISVTSFLKPFFLLICSSTREKTKPEKSLARNSGGFFGSSTKIPCPALSPSLRIYLTVSPQQLRNVNTLPV